jgi:hypothetical protein
MHQVVEKGRLVMRTRVLEGFVSVRFPSFLIAEFVLVGAERVDANYESPSTGSSRWTNGEISCTNFITVVHFVINFRVSSGRRSYRPRFWLLYQRVKSVDKRTIQPYLREKFH